jgi:choline dehydrogenase
MTEHHDVVIVGGGSAGCTLAARLSESASRTVMLIEAGRDYGSINAFPSALRSTLSSAASLPGSPDSWPLMANIVDGKAYPITRGRVLGGSSAVNGTLFVRGHPNDFHEWRAAGNRGWDYEDVLPFFRRSESDLDFGDTDVHGATGPMPVKRSDRNCLSPVSSAFVQGCLDLGFPWDNDLNGRSPWGVGLLPSNSVSGVRHNVAVQYIDPVRRRPNLTIADRHVVREIIIRNGRATGVRVLTGKAERIVTGDQIILCAGGIHSPQLLMLSGVGPADHLRGLGIDVSVDLPSVGQHLMDHPSVHLPFRVHRSAREAVGILPIAEVNLGYASRDRLGSIDETFRLMPILYSMQDMLFGNSSLSGKISTISRSFRTLQKLLGASVSALSADVRHRNYLSMLCSLAVEGSRGELRLRSSDPADLPIIDFRYLSQREDLDQMVGGIQLTADLFQTSAFRAMGASIQLDRGTLSSPKVLATWVRANIGTSYHTSSTCRMGPDDSGEFVVDSDFRVYGVENLRIVDMSVMPQLVRRPPHGSVVMIAEKAAALLRGEGTQT